MNRIFCYNFFSEIEEDISSYSISHTSTEGERLPQCIASIAASEATNIQSKNVMEDRTVLSQDFTSLGMLLAILLYYYSFSFSSVDKRRITNRIHMVCLCGVSLSTFDSETQILIIFGPH